MLRRHLVALAAVVSVGLLAFGQPAVAQSTPSCPHEESDREAIARTLEAAISCKAAHDLMNACRSNTSGDVELAEIVIGKCEATFLAGLSAKAKGTYDGERAQCRKRYAGKRGTMYVSFAATCEAGVAARWEGRAARAR